MTDILLDQLSPPETQFWYMIQYNRTKICNILFRYVLYCWIFVHKAGFPRGIESIEQVLNFKIGFQDFFF